MTPQEAGVLLAMAGTLDGRLKPANDEDAKLKIVAWAAVLDPDMPLEAAKTALKRHYADSVKAIMPADLNTAWRAHKRVKAEVEASSRTVGAIEAAAIDAVPMPEAVRQQIRAILTKTNVDRSQ